jgi:hypothetical protein
MKADSTKSEKDVFGFREIDEENLQKLDFEELSDKLEQVKEDLEGYGKYFIEQKQLNDKHLVLFQETLKNLAKDREEFKKHKKNLKCLILTVQILIGSSLLFASFVLFHIFRL